MINWQRNEDGEFEWVVLRGERLVADGPNGGNLRTERNWIYYDRQKYARFRQTEVDGKKGPIEAHRRGDARAGEAEPDAGVRDQMGDGLWLMNKAALLQLEHFNKSNALAWALTMGLFAMPVVYSDREWNQIGGRQLLHPAGAERQVRVDGAGGSCLPDRGWTTWSG